MMPQPNEPAGQGLHLIFKFLLCIDCFKSHLYSVISNVRLCSKSLPSLLKDLILRKKLGSHPLSPQLSPSVEQEWLDRIIVEGPSTSPGISRRGSHPTMLGSFSSLHFLSVQKCGWWHHILPDFILVMSSQRAKYRAEK